MGLQGRVGYVGYEDGGKSGSVLRNLWWRFLLRT